MADYWHLPTTRGVPRLGSGAALLPLGFHLDELGSDWQKCRFLLGSPPALAVSALAGSTTAYRDILRATAEFLRAVYDNPPNRPPPWS